MNLFLTLLQFQQFGNQKFGDFSNNKLEETSKPTNDNSRYSALYQAVIGCFFHNMTPSISDGATLSEAVKGSLNGSEFEFSSNGSAYL